jgi:GAF domain-containing protein
MTLTDPIEFAHENNLARGVARQAAQAILNARHREEEQARSRHSRQYVRF